ncbi:MAG: tetratricopeptide repeat protein [Planctomycetes bacterium]|nr:tetratricopeptide repeat protein [Planctomycetota bacterium]
MLRHAAALGCLALVATFAVADTTVSPEARALFEKAEIAREEGRLAEAADFYKQAIELHPLYEEAHAGYLAALRGTGELGTAVPLYAGLVAKHPDSAELKAFEASAKEPGAAVAALDPLSKQHPASFRVQLEYARALLYAQRLPEAEAALKAALKLDAASSVARTLLGDVYFADGKLPKARKEYEGVLETDVSSVPAQLRLALALHRMGSSADAVTLLSRILADDNFPRLAAGHWLMAVIRSETDQIDEALKSIDRLLAVDVDDYDGLIAKGLLLLKNKPMDATAVFQKAVEKYPKSSDALFCLGWAFERAADAPEIQSAAKQERLAKAAEAYEKCASMDPGVRPRDSLGFVYLLTNKHAEATKEFRRATDIDPKFPPAHNNLGLASDMADNRADAKNRYQMVLDKVDKENVRARVMLALDLWLDGSAAKAIKELERVVKDAPNDDLAWTFLGDVYYDANKVDSAIKAYKKASELNEKNFYAWFHMGRAYEDDKRKYEEAERCYQKAIQVRADPPAEIFLRLGMLHDVGALDNPEKAIQYYQAFLDNGGDVSGDFAWVPGRIEELRELVGKKK